MWRSEIRSSTADINRSCGIASKQLAMSVSTAHRLPLQDLDLPRSGGHGLTWE
jgi:hypothetical protein